MAPFEFQVVPFELGVSAVGLRHPIEECCLVVDQQRHRFFEATVALLATAASGLSVAR